jgi:hypothetical protein
MIRSMSVKSIPLIPLCLLVCLGLSGCAIVRPHLETQQSTPIDWGLECTRSSAITVLPFITNVPDSSWGIYAGQRMQEHLLAEKAFERVLYAEKEPVLTQYLLKGTIDGQYYGGTLTPSTVQVTVRVINRQDGQTRYLTKVSAAAENRGLDLELLTRMYVSAPYPEQLLNGLLKQAAKDIAQRTGPSAPCTSEQK